jgi:thiol-disulfide isomerase/thioredoxin
MALTTTGPQVKDGTWSPVLAILRERYITKPEIKQAVLILARVPDETGEKLMREVITKNPDHKLQAKACKALIDLQEGAAQAGERLKGDETIRKSAEARLGKDYVEKLIGGAGKAKADMDELRKLLRSKYSDVYPDLSIGRPAPEVVSKDINGKEVKLSALKGKVVVLDIWATWCPPCRAMIPHEREMVQKLKDKPFELISVSADAEKKTLVDFLAKEAMPWTHWWNGAQGGILEDWDVRAFPTVYVLDAQGVIRHKDLREAKLEDAVKDLLKELDAKK